MTESDCSHDIPVPGNTPRQNPASNIGPGPLALPSNAMYQAAVGRNEPASLVEQHTADVFKTH